MVEFSKIKAGHYYSRKTLALLWNYKAHQALSRGVVTPANTKTIVLFVTMEKQSSLTQYTDYINYDYLYWEGEEKGGNNQRIINSSVNGDTIHLFYRHRHHQDFQYIGTVELKSFVRSETNPFQFIFKIIGASSITEPIGFDDFLFDDSIVRSTESSSLQLSRVGQGIFRIKLIQLWRSCSLTDIDFPEILRASHIKPWSVSDNQERLNPYNGLLLTPTYDVLFDKGYISFRDDGHMLLSKQVEPRKDALHVSPDMKLRFIHPDNLPFLEFHRDVLFNR
jgi:putative restriction endonuclease